MPAQLALTDEDWNMLLRRIRSGTCVPFMGAAVNSGLLPLGTQIANEWADKHQYPLESRSDLAKVAQYVGVQGDAFLPKELILDLLDKRLKPLDLDDDTQPLNVFAKLPFPLYLTTNYDDLLYGAIEHHGRAEKRKPLREICKWNPGDGGQPKVLKRSDGLQLSAKAPLVYHLHGHKSEASSIVLAEDDYLDFMVYMSKSFGELLPPQIQQAFTQSLMFVGYGLADIDFRVIFRLLRRTLQSRTGDHCGNDPYGRCTSLVESRT